MSAAILAILSAALLACSGAIFGVIMARVIWADDLKHAQRIDEVRSRTENSLRGLISSQERTIKTYKDRLGEK